MSTAKESQRPYGFVVIKEGQRNMLKVYSREDGSCHAYEVTNEQAVNLAHGFIQLIWQHMQVIPR